MSGQLDCWGSCEKRVGLTVTFKTSRGANISLNTLIIRIENNKTAPASRDAVSCSLFGMYSSNRKMKHLQGWLILSSVSGFVRFCQMYACCNHHSPIKTGREFPVDSEGLSMFILSFCMFSQIFLFQINPTLCFKGEPSSFLSISVWQSFIFVFGLFKFAQFSCRTHIKRAVFKEGKVFSPHFLLCCQASKALQEAWVRSISISPIVHVLPSF